MSRSPWAGWSPGWRSPRSATPRCGRSSQACYDLHGEGESPTFERVALRLDDAGVRSLAAGLLLPTTATRAIAIRSTRSRSPRGPARPLGGPPGAGPGHVRRTRSARSPAGPQGGPGRDRRIDPPRRASCPETRILSTSFQTAGHEDENRVLTRRSVGRAPHGKIGRGPQDAPRLGQAARLPDLRPGQRLPARRGRQPREDPRPAGVARRAGHRADRRGRGRGPPARLGRHRRRARGRRRRAGRRRRRRADPRGPRRDLPADRRPGPHVPHPDGRDPAARPASRKSPSPRRSRSPASASAARSSSATTPCGSVVETPQARPHAATCRSTARSRCR